MKSSLNSSLVLIIFILLSIVPLQASGDTAEPRVNIIADTIVQERSGAVMKASGDVRVRWQGYTLNADRVDYDDAERTAAASGGVKLLRGDDILTSDTLKIGVDTKEGVAANGTLIMGLNAKPGAVREKLKMKGALIEKLGDDRYRLGKGTFTTCEADPPSWEFSADNLDMTVEGFAEGRHVVFSIADIPVFYTPYILFPVMQERQSGFLLPRIGNSTKKGFFADIPYYWAISPSTEATFDLDMQTNRGVGTGIDAAWLRRSGSHGDLKVYAIYDTQLSRERADILAGVKEAVSTGTEFNADLNLATDRSFYRDFSELSGDYNRQALDSSLSLSRKWDSWYIAGETRILNDLDGSENQRTLQRLPEITLASTGQRIGDLPLYAGFDGRYTNFYRREDVTGGRITLQPDLTYYTPLAPAVSLSAWGGYQQRLYYASGGEGAGESGTGQAIAGARTSASLSRLYEVSLGDITRLKHSLTPVLEYSYVQERSQNSLPFLDYDDRVLGTNLASWSLVNTFTGRFETAGSPSYREILNLRLTQGYMLSGERRDLLDPADEGGRFTDIRLEATARPLTSLSIDADTRFSSYNGDITTSAVAATLNDGSGNEAGIGYRRISGALHYIDGKLTLNRFKPFNFQYTSRYSIDGEKFLENYYLVGYRHQCWSIALSYRDRPDNKEFLVTFSLAGIGGVGKVKAF